MVGSCAFFFVYTYVVLDHPCPSMTSGNPNLLASWLFVVKPHCFLGCAACATLKVRALMERGTWNDRRSRQTAFL